MARMAIRKTDSGTIVLHWMLAVLMVVSVATGLRIAIGSPYDMLWLHSLDAYLPQSMVWTLHIPVGTLLFALSVSYAIYLSRAHLFRRVKPDMGRLAGLAGPRRAKLGALNVILYWVLFAAISVQLGTGILLYLGFAGAFGDLHLYGTFIVVAYVPAHILVHAALGGRSQLLRILNPGKLSPPPARFDPYEMIAETMRLRGGWQCRACRQCGTPRPAPPHSGR